MGLLYKLSFGSGKSYIGQTVKTLQARFNQHKQAAMNGSMLAVHCAWRSHGAPVAEILGEYEDGDALHAAEIEAIRSAGTLSPGGYNVSTGGDTAPSKAPEVAAKIADKARGRKVPDHVKAALREASIARWADPIYQAKVRKGLLSSQTEEVKKKLSEAQVRIWEKKRESGWSVSEETRAKLRGKVVSEETRRKMSEAAKARKRGPVSASTRQKMSASGKRSWGTEEQRKERGAAISAALKAKREELSEAARKRWADPEYRAAVMAAKQAAEERRKGP